MNLIISTASWVFLVDADSHEFSVIKGSEPEYYGISWPFDGKHLCLGHSGMDNAQLMNSRGYFLSEKATISLGDRKRLNCLSLPHQILCTQDHILAANTGRNCITVLNQTDLFYRHHWVDEVQWDHETADGITGSHFNSLYSVDDRLLLLAHNNGADNHSYILELAWPSLEVIRRIDTCASQAHNVWMPSDGQIIVCDSSRGSVVEVISGCTLWRSERRKSYTRGLACDGKTLFVGDSMDLGSRRARLISDGGIWVLDKDTGKELDHIQLPNSGCVHEVRILDKPDQCHHGRPFVGTLSTDEQAAQRYLQHVEKFRRMITDDFRLGDDYWSVFQGFVFVVGNQSICTDEQTLSVAIRNEPMALDVRVGAEVWLSGEEEFRHAGLVARYAGPGDANMYLGMLNCERGSCRAEIWRNIEGKWEMLAHKPIPEDHGVMSFEVEAQLLALSINNRPVVNISDDALNAPGKVGVRSLDGGFANFHVTIKP